jgi:acyl CoA:acetate/3-ketoacid CoA transferase beta subunit
LFTPEEQAAVDAHSQALGLTVDEYVHRTVTDRAVAWRRTQDSMSALAQRRGVSVDDVLRRGCLSDGDHC